MIPILVFIAYLIDLYQIVVIAAVILSWLIAFNVINTYNPFVRTLWDAMKAMTEPLLRPIRNFLPAPGGLDLSPIVLWLALEFIGDVLIMQIIVPALR